MKRKVKKFKEGGYEATDDYKNLMSAADREGVEYTGGEFAKTLKPPAQSQTPAPAMGFGSFKEAFADARKSGNKTFEWMGKKYTTELAAPKTRTATQEAQDDAKIFGSKAAAEGITASKLPREARGIADTRSTGQKFAARQERAADVMRRARREQLGMKAGGKVSSASKRADGIAKRGKTRGRIV